MERNISTYFIVIQSPACLRELTLTADLWLNILLCQLRECSSTGKGCLTVYAIKGGDGTPHLVAECYQ